MNNSQDFQGERGMVMGHDTRALISSNAFRWSALQVASMEKFCHDKMLNHASIPGIDKSELLKALNLARYDGLVTAGNELVTDIIARKLNWKLGQVLKSLSIATTTTTTTTPSEPQVAALPMYFTRGERDGDVDGPSSPLSPFIIHNVINSNNSDAMNDRRTSSNNDASNDRYASVPKTDNGKGEAHQMAPSNSTWQSYHARAEDASSTNLDLHPGLENIRFDDHHASTDNMSQCTTESHRKEKRQVEFLERYLQEKDAAKKQVLHERVSSPMLGLDASLHARNIHSNMPGRFIEDGTTNDATSSQASEVHRASERRGTTSIPRPQQTAIAAGGSRGGNDMGVAHEGAHSVQYPALQKPNAWKIPTALARETNNAQPLINLSEGALNSRCDVPLQRHQHQQQQQQQSTQKQHHNQILKSQLQHSTSRLESLTHSTAEHLHTALTHTHKSLSIARTAMAGIQEQMMAAEKYLEMLQLEMVGLVEERKVMVGALSGLRGLVEMNGGNGNGNGAGLEDEEFAL